MQVFQVVRRDAAEAMEAEVGLHPAVVRRGVRSEDGGAGPPSTLHPPWPRLGSGVCTPVCGECGEQIIAAVTLLGNP